MYFDLEPTSDKDRFPFDADEDHLTDMYVVSYCFIRNFHKSYLLDKITVVRSFSDSFVDLGDFSCITSEMLELRHYLTIRQLYSCIQNVAAKKTHNALIEMFCCKLKLVVDICKKWINTKFISRLKLSLETWKIFKEQNPLNFDDPCCVCGFDLSVSKKYGPKSDKMSYYDFIIKKEDHFFQNIFTNEELKMSESICDLDTYYRCFEMFVYICTHLCVKYSKNFPMNMLKDEEIINFMANVAWKCYMKKVQT